MSLKNVRLEVMKFLEKDVDALIEKYLIPIDSIWQPTDFLPNSEVTTKLFLKKLGKLGNYPKNYHTIFGLFW